MRAILKLSLTSLVLLLFINLLAIGVKYEGCKDLPAGEWKAWYGNRNGGLDFHNSVMIVNGGDGAPGYNAKVLNCAFNKNTMQVSWSAVVIVARGAKPQILDFTGIYSVKQRRIDGTWTTSAIPGFKYKWSAEDKGLPPSRVKPPEPPDDVIVNPVPPDPNPSVNSLSGTWNLYSGGQIGTKDEKNIHYTGIIVFTEPDRYLSFGTKEPLKNFSITNNKISFNRPLSGVTQKYAGTVSSKKIEGTFDHNGVKYYWRAEKK